MGINTPISGGGEGGEVTSAAVVEALDNAASIPDATPVSGDKILFKDTSDGGALKEMDYDDLPGAGGGLSNIVEDLTPQLGGSLDVNGQEIVSVATGSINLHSDGSVNVELGDSAGAHSLFILDSTSTEVASIDSNGEAVLAGLSMNGAIDAGGYNVNFVDNIRLSVPVATPLTVEGSIYYDDTNRCPVYKNDEPDVTHKIGQQNWVRVYNNSGSTIVAGRLVYISGKEDVENRPTVALAIASAAGTSAVLGMSLHAIENSTFGWVTQFGEVQNIDTSGFSDGAAVWLSASTPGALTATRPQPPNLAVFVGYVLDSHATTGNILFTTVVDTGAAQISTFGATLVDDASAAAARTTLGVVIGTDVQAFSSVLANTTASFTTSDETKLDGIEALADVTDTANVTAAGALMDSEVASLSGVKTLVVPDSTTISTFGASLVDDTTASAARTTLGAQAEIGGAVITGVTPATGDKVLLQDVSASDALRVSTVADILALKTVDVVSNVATQTILGRSTAGSGDSEELSAASARAILNVEDGADVTDAANVTSALSGAVITTVTPASGDKILLQDVSNSDALRVALFSDFGGGGGSFALPSRNDNTTETLSATTHTRVSITTATITKTLPSAPTDGSFIGVTLDAVTEGTGSVTIARGGSDTITWKGVALTSVQLREDGDGIILFYDADNTTWRLVYDGIKGPTFIGSRITSNQTYSTSTATKMQWNGETQDYHGAFDNATTYRWLPLIPGHYAIEFTAKLECDAPAAYLRVMLYKNGSLDRWGVFDVSAGNEPRRHETFQTYLNGSSDYIELYMFNQGAAPFFATEDSYIEIRRVR